MINATARREVRKATALVLAGDRSGAAAILRRLAAMPDRVFETPGQLALQFVTFRCEQLEGKETQAHVCVARQVQSEAERTQDTWRGQSPTHPSCQTHLCAQGRRVREALARDGAPNVKRWRGAKR